MLDLLRGCRIIDLTTIVLGPYATQILGDMGGDVIKVESPSGDLFRANSAARSPGMSPGYLNSNRNKRSLSLDLKTAEGRQVLRDLVASADVLVHNMRPQAAERLGLSYADLKAVNPTLVYCAGPGYGQGGRYADHPAYDDVIQAASGVAHLNATAEGQPRFLPTILCDKITGLHLALAVLGGVARRYREGRGCYVEVPMFETMLSFLYVEHLDGLSFVPALESGAYYDRIVNPYRKPYATRDGYIAALPYNSQHWTRFFTLAGRPDLVESSWVTDPQQRSRNIRRLYQLLDEIFPTRTTEDWLRDLRKADIPCAPVNDLASLLDDPHLADVGFFSEFDHPSEGRLRQVNSPFQTRDTEHHPDRHAPRIGEHSRQVLCELGLSDDAIETLISNGVVIQG